MGRRMILAVALAALAAALAFFSCAVADELVSLERSSRFGFVREVDEPLARGKLIRISPADFDVHWRFTFSPEGRSIVFSGRRFDSDDPLQLYRIDIEGSAPVKITAGGEENVGDPSFTSDGRYIVYNSGGNFWKIRGDGAGAKVKVPGSGLNRDNNPQLSRQDIVAFVTIDPYINRSLIWTVELDGGNLTQYREGNYPTWSPDGMKIVFEYEGDLYMMNADGTQLTQLTSTRYIIEGLPSFSPDGKYIVYVSNEGSSGDTNIWYMKTDGMGKTQMTELQSWDSWPVWGKDGVYFLSGRGSGDINVQRIWRISI